MTISVNILGIEGKEIYMLRRSKYDARKKVVDLFLLDDGEHMYYTVIKSLRMLLRSSNTKHKCKQHFGRNCLQGFPTKVIRDKHLKYSKDNETVGIEMPKRG